MVKIGTHSGAFHQDEALAVYMLRQLPKFKDAELVRSRDNDVLDQCDIVVDVSGKYEPPKYFDHHQREFTTTFDEKHTVTKLSSAGLVYKHFGREVLAAMLNVEESSPVIDACYVRIYDQFIEAVDAYDNGVSPFDGTEKFDSYGITLRAVVASMVPKWTESDKPEDYDRQFELASALMGQAFKLHVEKMGLSWYPAKDAVQKAFEQRTQYDEAGRILVFDQYVPWQGHIYNLEKEFGAKILYVIYPAADSTRIQAVAVSSGSFESRKPLPENWRGLRDEKLSEVTGVSNCTFIHAAGFIGGTKSKSETLELAKKALDA